MREFISFAEAQRTVLEAVGPVETERVSLDDALERTLAEDVTARENIPPFDNSAMDGYALRSEDVDGVGTVLPCVGEVAAGSDGKIEVEAHTCVSIMTGAPIPKGTDTVVPIEQTERQDLGVRFDVTPSAGDNVRRAGEDLRTGERVIESGLVIKPGAIAVLASLGFAEVTVAKQPVAAVVATGSELVDVSEQPGPGQIRDSNGPALRALVRSAGGRVLGPWRARDERAEIRACLERALEADLVVISGGVSVGEYDLVKDELDALGMELLFWKVRQRPGKPIAFGLIDGTPIFGLPGNPVSSAVSFHEYVRPALAKMQGRSVVRTPPATGVLSAPLRKVKGLHYFARGFGRWSNGRLVIDPAEHQGSHVATSLLRANGLIHLPEDLDEAPAGLEVQFEYLD